MTSLISVSIADLNLYPHPVVIELCLDPTSTINTTRSILRSIHQHTRTEFIIVIFALLLIGLYNTRVSILPMSMDLDSADLEPEQIAYFYTDNCAMTAIDLLSRCRHTQLVSQV